MSQTSSFIMSAVRSGSALRALVLTPERIPDFFIPSRSPLLRLTPRFHRTSLDRTRLLSEDEDCPATSPSETPVTPEAASRFRLRLPSPRIGRVRHCSGTAAESADTDLTTRAAMSLPHVGKVTTPYGFRAVLAASPCTRRRESLFHQKKPVTLTVTDCDQQAPLDPPPPGPSASSSQMDPSGSGPSPSRSKVVCSRPIKALGLQVIKELKKPSAALRALSPAARKTRPR